MGASNIKGDIAELVVAQRFMEKGYWVSTPYGDDAPYDLIVDIGTELKRVQVKCARYNDGCLTCLLISSGGRRYKECCDWVVLYHPELGCYLIDLSLYTNDNAICLRVEDSRRPGLTTIRYAKDYVL